MRAKEFITEAPIEDFRVFGTFGSDKSHNSIFFPSDDELLHSEKGVAKIINAFRNTPYQFNIYILMPTITRTSGLNNLVLGDPKHLMHTIQNDLGHPIKTEGRITVIFTNNVNNTNGMPMNKWTIAHRIGHAIQAPSQVEINEHARAVEERIMNIFVKCCGAILNKSISAKHVVLGVRIDNQYSGVKNQDLYKLATKLLSMKSARTGTLNSLEFEAFAEMVAQYLLKGKVYLNRIDPNFNDIIEQTEISINQQLDELFGFLVNKVIRF